MVVVGTVPELPDGLWTTRILPFLAVPDLLRCERTCRALASLIGNHDEVWLDCPGATDAYQQAMSTYRERASVAHVLDLIHTEQKKTDNIIESSLGIPLWLEMVHTTLHRALASEDYAQLFHDFLSVTKEDRPVHARFNRFPGLNAYYNQFRVRGESEDDRTMANLALNTSNGGFIPASACNQFHVRGDASFVLMEMLQQSLIETFQQAHDTTVSVLQEEYPIVTANGLAVQLNSERHFIRHSFSNRLSWEPTTSFVRDIATYSFVGLENAPPELTMDGIMDDIIIQKMMRRISLRAGVVKLSNDCYRLAWERALETILLILLPACHYHLQLFALQQKNLEQDGTVQEDAAGGTGTGIEVPLRRLDLHEPMRDVAPNPYFSRSVNRWTALAPNPRGMIRRRYDNGFPYVVANHVLVPKQLEEVARCVPSLSRCVHKYGNGWHVVDPMSATLEQEIAQARAMYTYDGDDDDSSSDDDELTPCAYLPKDEDDHDAYVNAAAAVALLEDDDADDDDDDDCSWSSGTYYDEMSSDDGTTTTTSDNEDQDESTRRNEREDGILCRMNLRIEHLLIHTGVRRLFSIVKNAILIFIAHFIGMLVGVILAIVVVFIVQSIVKQQNADVGRNRLDPEF